MDAAEVFDGVVAHIRRDPACQAIISAWVRGWHQENARAVDERFRGLVLDAVCGPL